MGLLKKGGGKAFWVAKEAPLVATLIDGLNFH